MFERLIWLAMRVLTVAAGVIAAVWFIGCSLLLLWVAFWLLDFFVSLVAR